MEHIGPPPRDDRSPDDPDAYDLCDHCGAVVPDVDLLGALVPDSSALHVSDPGLDGKRVLTACSVDHLAELVDHYRRRPFVPVEQWAAKVCRTLSEYDDPVPIDRVAELSGISEQQAREGVEWHNARAREWRARYGDDPGPAPDPGGPR
ncbi:hypothetical protein ACWEQL_06920 [Kitasatospora sp. NPDC004240]